MTFLRSNVTDILVVVGLAAIVAGCGLVALPLGLIVGGALLVGFGLLLGG